MTIESSKSLTVTGKSGQLCNKTVNVTAIQRGEAGTADYVAHLSTGQVKLLAIAAGNKKRHGDRNSLLIKFIYDGALRVSETINITPDDIYQDNGGWLVKVLGKGNKPGVLALSATMAAETQAFCYRHNIGRSQKIFNISRSQVFRIVDQAYKDAGIPCPTVEDDHVGRLHVLRHSGAIERLRLTGNPKAVQEQLRHKSALMTLRYMKTIGHDEAIATQQKVDPW